MLSLAATPVVRDLFLRANLVDLPDANRKRHALPTPRCGGIGVAIAYVAAFAALPAAPWSLLPAFAMVFFTGLADDLVTLRARYKLLGQVIAALMAYGAGLDVAGGHWSGLPLTLLWLTACSNAFNLIDGLDGAAAGLGVSAAVTMTVAGVLGGNAPLTVVAAPLAGALLGFLRHNFAPASVFLGDSGSLPAGFLLGCGSVLWMRAAQSPWGLAAPAMALAVPLLDTGLSVLRRLTRGHPVFRGDHGHIHHRLLALGLRPREAALAMYAMAAAGSLPALVPSGPAVMAFAVAGVALAHALRYPEFAAAWRVLTAARPRREVRERMALAEFEAAIERAGTVEACWDCIAAACRQFGLAGARLSVSGRIHELSLAPPAAPVWTIRTPLGSNAVLVLSCPYGAGASSRILPVFVDSLRAKCGRRLAEVEQAPWSGPLVVRGRAAGA